MTSSDPIRLTVYQPDIALNLGAMIRLCACLATPIEVIEPCGFPFSPRAVRRSAMDYAELAQITRFDSWAAFQRLRGPGRLILLTTAAEATLWTHRFEAGDRLLLGRESAGAPAEVHGAADHRIRIPTAPGARSLNIAAAAAIALAEARRQLGLVD